MEKQADTALTDIGHKLAAIMGRQTDEQPNIQVEKQAAKICIQMFYMQIRSRQWG